MGKYRRRPLTIPVIAIQCYGYAVPSPENSAVELPVGRTDISRIQHGGCLNFILPLLDLFVNKYMSFRHNVRWRAVPSQIVRQMDASTTLFSRRGPDDEAAILYEGAYMSRYQPVSSRSGGYVSFAYEELDLAS
jgi:hypothetical protein